MKKVTSKQLVPIELLYGADSPIALTDRLVLLIGTFEGKDGCWLSVKKMTSILDAKPQTVKRCLRRLQKRGTLRRTTWEDKYGNERWGWKVTEVDITDEQLNVINALAKKCIYVRPADRPAAEAAAQAEADERKRGPHVVHAVWNPDSVDPHRMALPDHWDYLTRPWEMPAFSSLGEPDASDEARRFWLSVSANVRKNKATWTRGFTDDDDRVQAALLMLGWHIHSKVQRGRPPKPSSGPANLLCHILKTLDPAKDEVTAVDPADVARDRTLLLQSCWSVRERLEGEHLKEDDELDDEDAA